MMTNLETRLKKETPFNGAIFDLDGTLLDSAAAIHGVCSEYVTLADSLLADTGDAAVKNLCLSAVSRYLRGEYPGANLFLKIFEHLMYITTRYYETVRINPGVLQFLTSLKAKGVKLCVVTASERPYAETALKCNGIFSEFSFVLTCTEAGAGKEFPSLYNHALKLLGTKKSRTLVFEDSLHAIKTVKAAGFRVAAVYNPLHENDRPFILELADYYISSCYDWEKLLLRTGFNVRHNMGNEKSP